MPPPDRLVLVAGTGTDVGKTWVAARTIERLVATGTRVAVRKPVQSFVPAAGPTDAEVLAAATGEDPERVCPPHRWYGREMAPPMAAEVLGLPPFTVDDLVAELAWPPGTDVGIVEGVGGPRSPLAGDGDTVTLARRLRPELVVVVADAGLGAINAVRLAVAAFAPQRVTVVLNRFDDAAGGLHQRNRRWLSEGDGLEVLTTPEALAQRLRPGGGGP